MKRLALPFLLAGSLVPAAGSAQQVATTPVPVVAAGNAVLTVSAEGRSFRTPDLAVFNAGVTTQGKTAGEALAANSTAMARVIAALKRAGIAERDIQTSNLSLNPVYSDPNRDAEIAARAARQPYVAPEPKAPVIIGYQANNSVSVRQRRLDDFGRVIDTLVSAGANQVNGPSFQMDDPDPAIDEARVEAMKKARTRAELYARTAGLRIVRILSISESAGYFGPPPGAFARMSAPSAPPPPPAPIAAGEVQLNANVTVLYELAP